jgi:predicted nuclease with RNAse H fold
MSDDEIRFETVYSDEAILEVSKRFKPDIIAIDAPLMQGEPRIRLADKMLKKYKALPPSLPSMKALTLRGSKLAEQLRKQFETIEVFPTATAKILNIYSRNFEETAEKLGIKVKNKHELDAYLCCLTAEMHLKKKTVKIGDENGEIVLPRA